MRKLDDNEFKLCQILGSIFEKSIDLSFQSSPMFIKRFMESDEAKTFFDKSYLTLSNNNEDIIDTLNSKYSKNTNKILYSKNQMYWIGYIYGSISFLYDLNAKRVYKLFPSKEIVKYYNIYHTFDVEEAAERMMENISFRNESYTEKGVQILKKLIYLDSLKQLLNKEVEVIIDRPINSRHPKFKDMIYPTNYGYIKNVVSLDGEYQDAYVLGIDEPINIFKGTVIAIVHRKNDIEDKLVVTNNKINLTDREIMDKIYFQEKYFKSKIIRK